MKQLPLGVRLRADAVFASFVAGANGEVLAALQSDAATPVWLWGGRGCGKTHLLQALCAAAGAAAASAAAAGAAAAGSAAYFPLARSAALPPDALGGFERCRVLCLDDVDAVAGDLAWEQALFRAFNESAELGTRVIFAACAAPRHLQWGLEDWQSRATSCVVYHLHALDDAGMAEALRLRAAQRGLHLAPEISDYLLRRLPRDLGSLLEMLDRLDEASLAAQRRLTLPFIRDALEQPVEKPAGKAP